MFELDLADLDFVSLFLGHRFPHVEDQVVVQTVDRRILRLQQLRHEIFHHALGVFELRFVLEEVVDLRDQLAPLLFHYLGHLNALSENTLYPFTIVRL